MFPKTFTTKAIKTIAPATPSIVFAMLSIPPDPFASFVAKIKAIIIDDK